jgi:hypothetical protein
MFSEQDKDMSGYIGREDVICMLLNANKVRLPKWLMESFKMEILLSARSFGSTLQDASSLSDQRVEECGLEWRHKNQFSRSKSFSIDNFLKQLCLIQSSSSTSTRQSTTLPACQSMWSF